MEGQSPIPGTAPEKKPELPTFPNVGVPSFVEKQESKPPVSFQMPQKPVEPPPRISYAPPPPPPPPPPSPPAAPIPEQVDLSKKIDPEESKKPIGPLIGIIIIVFLMILGGLYFWGKQLTELREQQQVQTL